MPIKKIKKRPAYDAGKVAERAAKAALKSSRICAVRLLSDISEQRQAGRKGNTIFQSLRDGSVVGAGANLAKAVTSLRFEWSITAFALCRDQMGQEYIKDISVQASKCRHDEIAEYVANILDELTNGINPAHLINQGWIGVPWPHETTREEVQMLVKRGFAYLSRWEHDKVALCN